jgi:hypothetical protein
MFRRLKTDEELIECTTYQSHRQLLLEISELRAYLDPNTRTLLRDLADKFKQYEGFTPKQVELLNGVLSDLKVKQQRNVKRLKEVNIPCDQCASKGYIWASHRENKCRYSFKCDCHFGNSVGYNYPVWDDSRLIEYELWERN